MQNINSASKPALIKQIRTLEKAATQNTIKEAEHEEQRLTANIVVSSLMTQTKRQKGKLEDIKKTIETLVALKHPGERLLAPIKKDDDHPKDHQRAIEMFNCNAGEHLTSLRHLYSFCN